MKVLFVGSCLEQLPLGAEALADLDIECRQDRDPSYDVVLTFDDGKLKLMWQKGQELKSAFYVDFLKKSVLYRQKTIHREQIFKKAIGTSAKSVLDMTGGWGSDTLLLAQMGFRVTAVEQNPIVYMLTNDAFERAKSNYSDMSSELVEAFKRVKYKFSEGIDWLQEQGFEAYDTAYIDPMFPEKKSKALSPKSMQVLQSLIGAGQRVEEMLNAARQYAKYRVVVKRPAKSEVLAEGCTHSFKGKSVRYDMYTVFQGNK